ncbi:Eukaryotic translation initiation factor 5 [Glycine soja]
MSKLAAPAQEKMSALVEALFEGTEKEFSCKSTSNALKEVALVLKALYDADVLEEEHIVQWYQKGLKGENKNSKIWKNVQPFIDWLQSAESETEEE